MKIAAGSAGEGEGGGGGGGGEARMRMWIRREYQDGEFVRVACGSECML